MICYHLSMICHDLSTDKITHIRYIDYTMDQMLEKAEMWDKSWTHDQKSRSHFTEMVTYALREMQDEYGKDQVKSHDHD